MSLHIGSAGRQARTDDFDFAQEAAGMMAGKRCGTGRK